MIKPAHTHSTTRDPNTGRIKVEHGDTAFITGASFRLDYVIDMTQGADPILFKFVISEPIDLTLSSIELVEGGVHYEVFSLLEAAEDAAFTTPVNRVFSRNSRVAGSSGVQVFTGGTITETGEASTNVFVRTASGGGNRASAVNSETSRRGFPATTAFAKISILDGVNTDVKGSYKLEWNTL